MEFLRGVLALLALFFGHMAGRSLVAVRKGRARQSRLIGWTIRTVLCCVAVLFPRRHVDLVAICIWALAALAFATGVWVASREKHEEDLTPTIFPDEP